MEYQEYLNDMKQNDREKALGILTTITEPHRSICISCENREYEIEEFIWDCVHFCNKQDKRCYDGLKDCEFYKEKF